MRERHAFWGTVGAAALADALLLFPYLHDRLMHRDEALALMLARRPTLEMLKTVQEVRGGAPLHFLLSDLVAQLGGGLAATRAISVVFAIAAVIGVALLGRALAGPIEGAVAAWGVAVSPVALYYGEFARMYSMFLAVTAFALWALVRALDTWSGRWWAVTAALLALDVYVHPYGVVVGVIGATGALLAIGRRHDRSAWRLPLRAAVGVLAGTAPLLAGYVVLASRAGNVPTPPDAAVHEPALNSVLYQAFAHFLGVPRAHGAVTLIGLYLVLLAVLGLVGLGAIARERPELGALCLAWLLLPVLTLAVVRIPNTDNHVRYVIDLLPVTLVLIAHGAVFLARRAGARAALAVGIALAVLVVAVDVGRGRLLRDYRYRTAASAVDRRAVDGDVAYLRATFARDDLFFGYDEAFGYAVVSPGGNGPLGAARGVARAEGPLVVRSLDHLDGPIAHGWYVALVYGRHDPARRYASFVSALGASFDVRRFGRWALVRTRAASLTRRQFARAGLTVFTAADTVLGDPNAPFTRAALSAALPDVRD